MKVPCTIKLDWLFWSLDALIIILEAANNNAMQPK